MRTIPAFHLEMKLQPGGCPTRASPGAQICQRTASSSTTASWLRLPGDNKGNNDPKGKVAGLRAGSNTL